MCKADSILGSDRMCKQLSERGFPEFQEDIPRLPPGRNGLCEDARAAEEPLFSSRLQHPFLLSLPFPSLTCRIGCCGRDPG